MGIVSAKLINGIDLLGSDLSRAFLWIVYRPSISDHTESLLESLVLFCIDIRKHLTLFDIVNHKNPSILETLWGIVILIPFQAWASRSFLPCVRSFRHGKLLGRIRNLLIFCLDVMLKCVCLYGILRLSRSYSSIRLRFGCSKLITGRIPLLWGRSLSLSGPRPLNFLLGEGPGVSSRWLLMTKDLEC